MNGAPDPAYVLARRVLLDALEALHVHLHALILVGAQAIYLRGGQNELAVSPYTTDAGLALDPLTLASAPKLVDLLTTAGFIATRNPGIWAGARGVTVDLLVPEALGGGGRRGARLGTHGNRAAQKVTGLEAALVDKDATTVASLDPADMRHSTVAVAGPAALLVAKLYKLEERLENPRRLDDKDALDIFRLLRLPSDDTASRFARALQDQRAGPVSRHALQSLADLFGSPDAPGARMAARSLTRLESPDTVALSCAALADELLSAIRTR